MTKDEIINYWVSSSDKDLKVMGSLFLPFTHDLAKLSEKAGLLLTEEQKDLLDEVTTFNIKARNPDYKGRFYKKATKRFAEGYVSKIKDFRRWLKKRVKE